MYTPKKWQCTSNKENVFDSGRLKSLQFKEVKILKIIRALNISKAHGYDDTPIRMRKFATNHYQNR